jgi:hypothetical protein
MKRGKRVGAQLKTLLLLSVKIFEEGILSNAPDKSC